MAITNADGSIILSTKLDTSGVSKGLTTIRNKFAALKDQKETISTLTQAIKDQQYVLDKLNIEYAELVAKGKQNSKQAQELKGRINDLTAEMKEMEAAATTLGAKTTSTFSKMRSAVARFASYFIGIQTIFASIRFSGESAEFYAQTEASVQRLVDIYGEASNAVGDFIDANARALGMSKAAAASFSSVYGNLFSVWADQATNAELTNQYLQMTAVVASKTGRTVEDVQERVRSGLLGNTEAIEDLGIFVNVKTIEMTDAFQRMADGKSWEQLDAYTQQQIRSMAILEQATAKYGDEVADTSATIRNRYKAAYEDFQNSWGNIVNTVLLPVLETLTQIFDVASRGLNVLSGIGGKILGNVQVEEEKTEETAENIEKQTENQKELNKELKKTLASFDDIQILSSQKEESPLDNVIELEDTKPSGATYEQEASSMLTAIMGFVSVAMVAIGVILLLTGHIGWGLGFIIAGAGLLTVTQASVTQDGIGIDVQNALTTALLIAGVAAIVIGIILCMCQQYVKGIALIALGAATVVADIAINWDSIKDMLSNEKVATWVAIGGILAVVLGILLCFAQQWWAGIGLIALGATALGVDVAVNWNAITEAFTNDKTAKWIAVGGIVAIVLGILLCFAHQWTWGIGLIALGAATVATVVVVNWDSIKEVLTDEKFAGWIAVAGIVAIVLGILLCFVNLPLGIGLIAIGAVAFVGVIALNWGAIINNIKTFLFENSTLISLISGGLLILGILICFVNLPLGIALIAAGAVGLVTVTALNWDSIVGWISGAWDEVKSFWNENIAPIFTAKWWTDLGKTCINGLIAGFEGGINGIIWAFESMINWIVDGLNKISFSLPSWIPGIGGKTFGIDIPRASLDRVSIPRLAQGAVIPPNREFLAVLGDQKHGTNIEAPLSTIQEAVSAVVSAQNDAMQSTLEQILEAILGIEIGDDVIGRASQRYNNSMIKMYGG